MSIKHCKACDHFVDTGHSLGVCRRFPVFQNRSPNERCGEFTPIDYGDPLPEMLALPVVEIPQERVKRKYTKRKVEA